MSNDVSNDMSYSKFPLLSSYLSILPEGLSSYPDHVQKASIARVTIDRWPSMRELAPALPTPLRNLIESPPPASVWVPEVHGMSLWLLVADGACGGDERAFLDFSLQTNREILSQKVYRMVLSVIGARLTVRAITAAWSAFHKGMKLETRLVDRGGDVELRHPPHLVPPIVTGSYAMAFRAGLELAGVQVLESVVVEKAPERTRFRIRW